MTDDLGPMRTCAECRDDWPDDGEFYRSDEDPLCRACRFEAEVDERRKRAAAARAYRARQSRAEMTA